MSKITFRADEDLVERIEALDASKSEVMREALREYLERDSRVASDERGAERDGGRRRTEFDAGERQAVRDEPIRRDRTSRARSDSLDALLTERVDALVAERLAAREARAPRERERQQDVNVNVTLETDSPVGTASADATRTGAANPSDAPSDRQVSDGASDGRRAAAGGAGREEKSCNQCGETLDDDHVYCPNCGEKAANRLFCECGDEIRSDWGFCPGCGRRTPSADVLDSP
ncbi:MULTISPECIES: double zinc ribbon domain-containing protein [Halorussus]|uniref:double zinc ribbon domain-containing protein n=1 Tax=Halorussus TaxID=1070314 RepID=UPI00209EE6BD|nr:zinc ribbon domain-containing protein [Halorussus vallis]USZ74884.1 ribbon-helix-helix protein, CopG family [Halorussus vallis]